MAVPRRALVLAALCAAVAAPSPGGVLDPPGPPGPTMKTLGEIPPTWSLRLDASDGASDGCNSTRFKCVLGGSAVLDNETGLVWEREPHRRGGGATTWTFARNRCAQLVVGSRGGWRLPSVTELSSLLRSALPADAPFQFQDSRTYWTMTTYAFFEEYAWTVRDGFSFQPVSWRPKTDEVYVWCVRAPAPLSVY